MICKVTIWLFWVSIGNDISKRRIVFLRHLNIFCVPCNVFFYPGQLTYTKLEGQSVERIYHRQRSSDGSVNKTILKPRLALANTSYTFDFPDVKFHIATQLAGSLGKAAKFRSLYDIAET